jgi:hypothetical protein
MSAGIHIDRATGADADDVLALMARAHLPTDGLAAHLDAAFVARDGDRIVGSAAIEIYEDGGLLRSVAVGRRVPRRRARRAPHRGCDRARAAPRAPGALSPHRRRPKTSFLDSGSSASRATSSGIGADVDRVPRRLPGLGDRDAEAPRINPNNS